MLIVIFDCVREPSGRNMRHVLASVILRILGSRVVHEDASYSFNQACNSKREVDSLVEASATASVVVSLESLFDRLLLLLHGLLSSHQPRWLKWKSNSKAPSESSKDYSAFEREGAESLQVCFLCPLICSLVELISTSVS